ncbi:MAG: hypothetical protein ACRDZ9_00155 [Acidimicrobiales bacterium]
MTGGDDLRASQAVLRATDLPGDGWTALGVPEETHGGEGASLDDCLGGFPDDEVAASATSPRFSRGDELAYSVAWVLSSEEAAQAGFDRLSDRRFVSCFVDAAAAEVDPDQGAATLLGHLATPLEHMEGLDRGAAHQARLTAATPEGVLAIHLDLVALRRGRGVSLLILADSPDPVAPALVRVVAERLSTRLAPG